MKYIMKYVLELSGSDFGKDHWSLLAYVETLCVDSSKGVGEIDKRRVRANESTHPLHAVNRSSVGKWNTDWGTRLSGYFLDKGVDLKRRIDEHDDWDCLNDLEEAGLINIISEANGFVKMTDKGMSVASRIREWKTKGGMFATFKYEEPSNG